MRRFIPFVPVFLLSLCPTLLVSNSLSASEQNAPAEAVASQGTELIKEGDLPAAEIELRKAEELAPQDTAILGNLGTVLAMEKKFDESTSVFQRALEIDPTNVTLRRYLAANLWQLQRYP